MKMKGKKKNLKKKRLITLLVFMIILEIVGISFAWLSYWHRLNTISVVQIPSRITISGANRSEMQKISLEMTSDDTQEGNKVTIRRVFCIESTDDYLLEVAHTTNIPNMEIKIFPVSTANSNIESDGSSSESTQGVVKGADEGKVFCYKPDGTAIAGGYLNKEGNIANKNLHNQVYSDGDKVQQNAEPLYWISSEAEKYDKNDYSGSGTSADGKTEIYYRYYVLELSWEIDQAETDMVYLLASHQE